jgi:hypothetical protein
MFTNAGDRPAGGERCPVRLVPGRKDDIVLVLRVAAHQQERGGGGGGGDGGDLPRHAGQPAPCLHLPARAAEEGQGRTQHDGGKVGLPTCLMTSE